MNDWGRNEGSDRAVRDKYGDFETVRLLFLVTQGGTRREGVTLSSCGEIKN